MHPDSSPTRRSSDLTNAHREWMKGGGAGHARMCNLGPIAQADANSHQRLKGIAARLPAETVPHPDAGRIKTASCPTGQSSNPYFTELRKPPCSKYRRK